MIFSLFVELVYIYIYMHMQVMTVCVCGVQVDNSVEDVM
jgi:hypothetical protein